MADEKDLSRVESRLESLDGKMDSILRLLGKVEPLVEEVPKLRDKIQAQEVALATLAAAHNTDLAAIKLELKETRWRAMLAGGISLTAAGGAVVHQMMQTLPTP